MNDAFGHAEASQLPRPTSPSDPRRCNSPLSKRTSLPIKGILARQSPPPPPAYSPTPTSPTSAPDATRAPRRCSSSSACVASIGARQRRAPFGTTSFDALGDNKVHKSRERLRSLQWAVDRFHVLLVFRPGCRPQPSAGATSCSTPPPAAECMSDAGLLGLSHFVLDSLCCSTLLAVYGHIHCISPGQSPRRLVAIFHL